MWAEIAARLKALCLNCLSLANGDRALLREIAVAYWTDPLVNRQNAMFQQDAKAESKSMVSVAVRWSSDGRHILLSYSTFLLRNDHLSLYPSIMHFLVSPRSNKGRIDVA